MRPGQSFHYITTWRIPPKRASLLQRLDPLMLDTDSPHSSSQDLHCQTTQCETPFQAQITHLCIAKLSLFLTMRQLGPTATNLWCSSTVEEANAFLLHSQLAPTLRQLDSSTNKDAVHQFTSIQAWAAPVIRQWHPSLQVLSLTSVTEWHVQSFPILKDLPSDKLSGALLKVSQCECSYKQKKRKSFLPSKLVLLPSTPSRKSRAGRSWRCWAGST